MVLQQVRRSVVRIAPLVSTLGIVIYRAMRLWVLVRLHLLAPLQGGTTRLTTRLQARLLEPQSTS